MTDKKDSAKGDAGAGQVQHKMDEWLEQGARGTLVDPTPNEAYTVAGVTSGAPTPETDSDLKKEAFEASHLTDDERINPDK